MSVRPSQPQIPESLSVVREFDVEVELERRVDFLAQYLARTGRQTYVLGISGGVDSLVAGCLAQRAVARLRASGDSVRFIAMRLPYGQQRDEAEAVRCLDFIAPDEVRTVDIRASVDAMQQALIAAGVDLGDAPAEDFLVGNIKARARMVAQYAVAGATAGLVIGTDHAAEALMGFFTKHGDGAADVLPLAGPNKRRVRAVGFALGAPRDLVMKVPTADLETLAPQRPDEDAFGVSYDTIDDFLEGLPIDREAERIIVNTYLASAHKRDAAVTPTMARSTL
ncbi:ammonia-dependent NAD(+) synthetase [Acidovorax sp. SUPP950]|uniref:ammonia-dependent NAD(+) synthetase n=1 Tax=Acidovorax sp. SUPP950 TaxID=511901 RepID=UPI0023C9CB22|nr:ammonia-dependent NAD(+) synthetase [Acidovorax sp. SUPP950]GKS73638.1 ammonia-dependent NAD(+) synthetase [Acidovorax sp. SUPP950]